MSLFGDATDDILGEDNLNEAIIEDNGHSETEGADENVATEEVKLKKRSVRNPRPRLTIEHLTGPRGIQTLENHFKDVELLGKGQEKADLNEIMRRLQHWAHRMYPHYKFDDILTNLERLGKKKELQRYMSRYRQGMLEESRQDEVRGETEEGEVPQDEPFDEFDALLGEQIAISKLGGSKTPSHHNNTSVVSSVVNTPKFVTGNAISSTPQHHCFEEQTESVSLAPTHSAASKLTTEQMARIAENRRLAQERLKAKAAAAVHLEK